MNYILNIEYNPYISNPYKFLELRWEKEKQVFNTGDFIVDFIDSQKWLGDKEFDFLIYSSSVDHFFLDTDLYQEMPVKNMADEWDESDLQFSNWEDYDFRTVKRKDMETFEEVRTYYKSKKNVQ